MTAVNGGWLFCFFVLLFWKADGRGMEGHEVRNTWARFEYCVLNMG